MSEPSVIAPAGELDIATVDALREQLAAVARRAGSDTLLDLSDVTFIDSTGLAAVIEADQIARLRRGRLAIVAPRGTAASSLLTLTGARRRLAVFESRTAAADAAAAAADAATAAAEAAQAAVDLPRDAA